MPSVEIHTAFLLRSEAKPLKNKSSVRRTPIKHRGAEKFLEKRPVKYT